MQIESKNIYGSAAQFSSNLSEKEQVQLKKSCNDFESIMISMILKSMDETVKKEELFSGGKGENLFNDMKNSAIAEEMTKQNGMGLGKLMFEQLTRSNSKINL